MLQSYTQRDVTVLVIEYFQIPIKISFENFLLTNSASGITFMLANVGCRSRRTTNEFRIPQLHKAILKKESCCAERTNLTKLALLCNILNLVQVVITLASS